MNYVLLRKSFELEIWVAEAEQLFSCLAPPLKIWLAPGQQVLLCTMPQTWNTTNNLHKRNLQNLLYTGIFEGFQCKSRQNLENVHNISLIYTSIACALAHYSMSSMPLCLQHFPSL